MDMTPVILIGVIGVILGLAIGLLTASLRMEKARSQTKATEGDPDSVEVARICFDKKSKSMYALLQGQEIRSSTALNSNQRTLISQIADLLNTLAGQPITQPSAPQEALTSTIKQDDLPQSSVEPSERPRISAIDVLSRAIQGDIKIPESEPKSIVAQIDEILQKKLDGSPLQSQGIQLMDIPEKGMVVMVGMEQYDDVESVPDPRIRDLIRSAVTEWENQESQSEVG